MLLVLRDYSGRIQISQTTGGIIQRNWLCGTMERHDKRVNGKQAD